MGHLRLGEGDWFEFDITRQLIIGDGEDQEIFQLSLTFTFEPTTKLQQLGHGDRWCGSNEDLERFRAFIHSTPAFLAVRCEMPPSVNLEYSVAG